MPTISQNCGAFLWIVEHWSRYLSITYYYKLCSALENYSAFYNFLAFLALLSILDPIYHEIFSNWFAMWILIINTIWIIHITNSSNISMSCLLGLMVEWLMIYKQFLLSKVWIQCESLIFFQKNFLLQEYLHFKVFEFSSSKVCVDDQRSHDE